MWKSTGVLKIDFKISIIMGFLRFNLYYLQVDKISIVSLLSLYEHNYLLPIEYSILIHSLSYNGQVIFDITPILLDEITLLSYDKGYSHSTLSTFYTYK